MGYLNAEKCKHCGEILVSLHRHDYVACPCGNAVDGGADYFRRTQVTDDPFDSSFRMVVAEINEAVAKRQIGNPK